MKGVIYILKNDLDLIEKINSRVYPLERPQQSALPAITVSVDDVDPHDTKSGVSRLDEVTITVISYGLSVEDAFTVKNLVRFALDRVSGEFNGETYQSIQYLREFSDKEEIDNKTIFFVEQEYKIREER